MLQFERNMKYNVILLFVLFVYNFTGSFSEESILNKIKSGFKLAGQLLGIDRVTSVSKLVTEAFSNTNTKKMDTNEKESNVFSSFLRILGFDAKKIGAIAVNTVIFIAQLISSSLGKISPPSPALATEEAREIKDGNPFTWISNNSRIYDIIQHIQHKNLSDHVIEYIKENSLDEESDCIQLLICKLSPFIEKMQTSLLQDEEKDYGKNLLHKYIPAKDEILKRSDNCDQEHPFCRLIY